MHKISNSCSSSPQTKSILSHHKTRNYCISYAVTYMHDIWDILLNSESPMHDDSFSYASLSSYVSSSDSASFFLLISCSLLIVKKTTTLHLTLYIIKYKYTSYILFKKFFLANSASFTSFSPFTNPQISLIHPSSYH